MRVSPWWSDWPGRDRSSGVLRAGLRPRLKLLPRLKIGAEENRTEGYQDTERITGQMMDFDWAGSHDDRRASIRRWRAWLETRRRGEKEGEPPR